MEHPAASTLQQQRIRMTGAHNRMFIGFNSDGEPIEHIVIKSCVWCSEEMPMDVDTAARIDDDEVYCNDCVDCADPFSASGIAIAWPGCSEYVYEVKQNAKRAQESPAARARTQAIDYETYLVVAAMRTVSAYAYGHTANQHLNSLVSSAACRWEFDTTEHIALSTN